MTAISTERPDTQQLQAEAEMHLTEALRHTRRVHLVDLEPDLLLVWARLHRLQGRTAEAHKQAEEALLIADRCGYSLKQAEVHNFLARLSADDANLETARQHAQAAREKAWCDGPPYCYRPALEEAERFLFVAPAPAAAGRAQAKPLMAKRKENGRKIGKIGESGDALLL